MKAPETNSTNRNLSIAAKIRVRTVGVVMLLALLGAGVTELHAQTQTPGAITPINLTLSGVSTNNYTQDFNTLANSGTSSTLPTGFAFVETLSDGLYTAGTGTTATGDTYSFGSTGSTDRAFGTLLSGSNAPTIGALFKNNSSSILRTLTISYTGEQWRLGNAGRTDKLQFGLSVNPTTGSITGGTYTPYTSLDFTAPVTTGATGALDGNAAANKRAITFTITGLSIAAGANFSIRFLDFDATGADDGLGIDDFSISGTVPEPSTVFGGILMMGALAWSQRRGIRYGLSALLAG